MTTETKRKNPDYAASAFKLTNPEEVKVLMDARKDLLTRKQMLEFQLQQANKAFFDAITELVGKLSSLDDKLRLTIENYGSYQDTEAGTYAVKQRCITYNYDPKAFKMNFPQFAPAVIVEAVDTRAIEGLIKGKLLDRENLIGLGVCLPKEAYTFIIKNG